MSRLKYVAVRVAPALLSVPLCMGGCDSGSDADEVLDIITVVAEIVLDILRVVL